MSLITRILAATALIFLTFSASAQKAKDVVRSPEMVEFFGLVDDKTRGFAASRALVNRSFAQYLHGDQPAQSVQELSKLYAAYDPTSATRFTPGMLFYHLARPIQILSESGAPQNAYLADIMQIRLLWLAGDPDQALTRARMVISQSALADTAMTSLLADASVLALRLGETERAEDYFQWAQSCSESPCRADIISQVLGSDRQPADTAFEGYNPDQQLALAGREALILFSGDSRVLDQIVQESEWFSDRSDRLIRDGLATALSAENVNQMNEADQQRLRRVSERLVLTYPFAKYLMQGDSIAGFFQSNAAAGEHKLPKDLEDTGYLDTDGIFADLMGGSLPLIQQQLRHSERRGDAFVADVIRSRILLAYGETERAIKELQSIIEEGRLAGFSDAEMFSALMDLWAAVKLSGQSGLAKRTWQATEPCRFRLCPEDFTLGFFARSGELPRVVRPDNLTPIELAAADPFMQDLFPDDALKLSDIYSAGNDQDYPMDAARNAELSIRFAESVADIALDDLVARAAKSMETLTYAARYADAAEIGKRIEKRVLDAGAKAAFTARFYRALARAAFRMDDPRAEEFYAAALKFGVSNDLAMDILDTTFTDLLEQVAKSTRVDRSIRARIRFRQGRFAQAAGLLAAKRRLAEAETEGNVRPDDPISYAKYSNLKALAYQEAVYRQAAGENDIAETLFALGGSPDWFGGDWAPLGNSSEADVSGYDSVTGWLDSSYNRLRPMLELRDSGNYEAAAEYMKAHRWVAVAAEANGQYIDAQALWQMAFTFARVGESDIAFDLMNRAARIAANLSFEGAGGAGGGTLQLLERDRWRYLLFVDIAWSAMSGEAPQDMLVVSRY